MDFCNGVRVAFVQEEVREADRRGYILPCEGGFVEIVKEMESA